MNFTERARALNKLISITVIAVFLLDSSSFARTLSSNTLRAESTALHVSSELAYNLKAAREPLVPEQADFNKSSSTGTVSVLAHKVPEIFSHLKNYDEQASMLYVHEEGLSSPFVYNRFLTALKMLFLSQADKGLSDKHKEAIYNFFSNNLKGSGKNKDSQDELFLDENGDSANKLFLSSGIAIITGIYNKALDDYKDMVLPVLEQNRSHYNPYCSALAVIGLALLGEMDEQALNDYRMEIIEELKDDLDSGHSDNKLMASVALAGFRMIDSEFLPDYEDAILDNLTDMSRNGDQYEKLMAFIGMAAISRKEEAFYRIIIRHSGLDEPVVILAKDAHEMVEALNKSLLMELGIESRLIAEGFIGLSSPAVNEGEESVVDIEQAFDIRFVLTIFLKSALSENMDSKASSSGININVDGLTVDGADLILDRLMRNRGLYSDNAFRAMESAEILLDFQDNNIEPHLDEIMKVLSGKKGFKNQELWLRLRAGLTLSKLGSRLRMRYAAEALYILGRTHFKEYINIDDIVSLLTGERGLKNNIDLVKRYAIEALSSIDREIVKRYSQDILDFLVSANGINSPNALRQVKSAIILSGLDRDMTAPYMDKTIAILCGKEGLRSDNTLKKTRAARALYGIDTEELAPYLKDIMGILQGKSGLKSDKAWARSCAAVATRLISSRSNTSPDVTPGKSSSSGVNVTIRKLEVKKALLEIIDKQISELTGIRGLRSQDKSVSFEAALQLAYLFNGENITKSHLNEIENILSSDKGLKSPDSMNRIQAIRGLEMLGKDVFSYYMSDAFNILNNILKDLQYRNSAIRTYAAVTYIFIAEKYLPAKEICIDCAWSDRPVVMLVSEDAKAKEIKLALDNSPLKDMGISSRVLKGNRIELSSKEISRPAVIRLGIEGELEKILASFVAAYPLKNSAGKSSSAGDEADINLNGLIELKNEIMPLINSLKSIEPSFRNGATEKLSKIRKKIISTPYLNDKISSDKNIARLEEEMDKLFLAPAFAAAETDAAYKELWMDYYRAQEAYYQAIIYIIDKIIEQAGAAVPLKSSSSGKDGIAITRLPSAPLYMGGNEYRIMLNSLRADIRSNDNELRLLSAMQLAIFANIYEEPFQKHKQEITSALLESFQSIDNHKSLVAAVGLAHVCLFDNAIASEYGDVLVKMFQQNIESGIREYKLLSAIGLVCLDLLRKDISPRYRNKAFFVIETGKTDASIDNRLFTAMELAVMERKGNIAYRVDIDFEVWGKPVTIYAKTPEELAERLRCKILDELEISCEVLDSGKLRFKTTATDKKMMQKEAGLDEPEKLKVALNSVISERLYALSGQGSPKTSPAGEKPVKDNPHAVRLAKLAADISDTRGRIIYDDIPLSLTRKQRLRLKALLEDMQKEMGSRIQVKLIEPNIVYDKKTIIISPRSLESINEYAKARHFRISGKDASYAEIVPLIAISSGLLALAEDKQEQPLLFNTVKNAIISLNSKSNIADIEKSLKLFIEENRPIFIDLPAPKTYDYEYIEEIQRQALEVFKYA